MIVVTSKISKSDRLENIRSRQLARREDLKKRPHPSAQTWQLARRIHHCSASLSVALASPSSLTGLGCARHLLLWCWLVVVLLLIQLGGGCCCCCCCWCCCLWLYSYHRLPPPPPTAASSSSSSSLPTILLRLRLGVAVVGWRWWWWCLWIFLWLVVVVFIIYILFLLQPQAVSSIIARILHELFVLEEEYWVLPVDDATGCGCWLIVML